MEHLSENIQQKEILECLLIEAWCFNSNMKVFWKFIINGEVLIPISL